MGGAEEMEDRVHMDAESLLPVVRREVGDLAGMGAAGGRHDVVEAAETFAGARHQRRGGCRIGGVAGEELDFAEALELGEVGVDLFVAAATVDQEADAALEERTGDRRADAARASGDDGCFLLAIRHFASPSSRQTPGFTPRAQLGTAEPCLIANATHRRQWPPPLGRETGQGQRRCRQA